MENEIRRLPDSELEVMQAVWECNIPATRKEIEEKLFPAHPMAMTTLLTLLTRLADKEFIKIEKIGRGSVYTPLVKKQAYLSAQSSRFFRKLCGGNVSAFANALCDSGLSKEELALLRSLLEEM